MNRHGATQGAYGVGDSGNDYKVLNVIKVPSWMQGLRVRGLELCNFSRLPASHDTNWLGDPVYYHPDPSKPLKYGVAYGTIESLAPDNWSATDIASIALDTEAKVRGPYQFHDPAAQNPDSVFEDGKGYHTASANTVVPPGQFIVLYATGKVIIEDHPTEGSGSAKISYDLNWHFAVNALCDAMVPVL